jgi:phenylacetic acid degradation operon negative regulatory protein
VRTADLFGISEGSARTALSRLASDGDVVASGGMYHLSPRLIERQWEQDVALRPRTRPWRGTWEMVLAAPDLVGATDLAALAPDLRRLRLGELRPGVWVRPDNLQREWPDALAGRALRFAARPDFRDPAPADLVARLWDLDSWNATAEALISAMAGGGDTARRFEIAATMVRHLRRDPLLPPSLQPDRWAGGRLRGAYDGYRRELGWLLERERDRE